MKTQKAYLVGTHRYSFQAGKPAEILRVVFITSNEDDIRLCYHVRFEDNQEGYTAISDSNHYEIISADDVKAGKIPAIIH